MKNKFITGLLLLSFPLIANAQQPISLDEAINKAVKSYPNLTAMRLNEEKNKIMQKSVSVLGDIELSGGGEEIGHGNDAVYTLARVRQNFDFFSAATRRNVFRQQTRLAQAETKVAERDLARQVSTDYIIDYATRLRCQSLQTLDSLYADFEQVAKRRYELQAISLLEYQAAANRRRQVSLSLEETRNDLEVAHRNLSRWLSADTIYMASQPDLSLTSTAIATDPSLHPKAQLAQERTMLAEADIKAAKRRLSPNLFVEGGVQKIGPHSGYYAWQVGISLPLSFGANRSVVKASKTELARIAAENEATMRSLSTERQTLLAAYGKYSKSVAYYQQTALPLAREQRRTATLSYREGSIGYLDLIQALTDAMNTEQSYIDAFAKLLDTKYKLLYY